jgi:hypothetical protein
MSPTRTYLLLSVMLLLTMVAVGAVIIQAGAGRIVFDDTPQQHLHSPP